MGRLKYAFELLANMFVFAFGAWLLFMFMESMNKGTLWWGEPNHAILWFEVCLAAFMTVVGIERLVDDLRYRDQFVKTWNFVLEIVADFLVIFGVGLMLGNFITFFFQRVPWDAGYVQFNMIIAGLIMVVGIERLFEDALKD